MSIRKRFSLLGSILFVAALLFTFSPLSAAPAHAASAHAAAPAAVSISCPPTQSEGASNDWVTVIQYKLNGFEQNDVISFSSYPLATDGSFGQNTYNAVVAFQQQSGITADEGVVNPQTWSMLGFCNVDSAHVPSGFTYGGSYCPSTQTEGDDNTFVNAMQHMINMAAYYSWISTTSPQSGWYPLSTDGDFGANTLKGVLNFQAGNDLTPDGSVGPKTWGAFGMCYSPL